MKLKYLRKLKPILLKVGKKHNIPVDEGEYIIGKLFESFRDAMYDPRLPKVRLPLIGTFYTSVSVLYRSLKPSIRFYKLGGTTYNYLKARIKYLWRIRGRLLNEKRHINTFSEWNSKKVKEEIKHLRLNEQEEKSKSKKEIYGGDNNPSESKDIFRSVRQRLLEENRKQWKSGRVKRR